MSLLDRPREKGHPERSGGSGGISIAYGRGESVKEAPAKQADAEQQGMGEELRMMESRKACWS